MLHCGFFKADLGGATHTCGVVIALLHSQEHNLIFLCAVFLSVGHSNEAKIVNLQAVSLSRIYRKDANFRD